MKTCEKITFSSWTNRFPFKSTGMPVMVTDC